MRRLLLQSAAFVRAAGGRMDRQAVSALVHDTLVGYYYQPPLGSTIGVPWSEDKVCDCVEKLRAALVEPYLQRFELRETYEQVGRAEPTYAEFWVVAKSGMYMEWYDPTTGQFGLGRNQKDSAAPVSIGCRGDLVGVFCAM